MTNDPKAIIGEILKRTAEDKARGEAFVKEFNILAAMTDDELLAFLADPRHLAWFRRLLAGALQCVQDNMSTIAGVEAFSTTVLAPKDVTLN